MKPMIGNEVRAQVGRCRLDGPPPGFGHLWPTCVRTETQVGQMRTDLLIGRGLAHRATSS